MGRWAGTGLPFRGVRFLRSRKAAPDCRASIRLSITPVSSPSAEEPEDSGEKIHHLSIHPYIQHLTIQYTYRATSTHTHICRAPSQNHIHPHTSLKPPAKTSSTHTHLHFPSQNHIHPHTSIESPAQTTSTPTHLWSPLPKPHLPTHIYMLPRHTPKKPL